MGDKCTLTVNGKQLRVSLGDTLVDAGLAARMLIPHDCCSGQCDTCLVRVVSGDVDPQGSDDGDLVRACQATIEGDAEILFDEVPVPAKRQGTLAAMRWLSHEVAEVVVRLNSPFTYLPGQYVKATFAGFPSRDYSPTAYLDGGLDEAELVFHIKRYEGGMVSVAATRSASATRSRSTDPTGTPSTARRRRASCSSRAAPAGPRSGRWRAPRAWRSPSARSSSSPAPAIRATSTWGRRWTGCRATASATSC